MRLMGELRTQGKTVVAVLHALIRLAGTAINWW